MGTFIHGIAASENIDSSGERLSIAGMDISSLEKDGVFNYEHEIAKIPDKDGRPLDIQIKIPAQVVGKILKARKIFSEKDCEDDFQLYFWNKILTPYLYVMGELFDDYTEAAKDLAGKFRYDQDHKDQNQSTVNNFSIEGGKLEKNGMDVAKSVARKVTITVTPCNKAAAAEMVPADTKQKDDINSLFKTESTQAEIFVGEPLAKAIKPPSLSLAPKFNPLGSSIGTVGKLNIMSHQGPQHFASASPQELRGISSKHYDAAQAAQQSRNQKLAMHHMNQVKRFMQAADRVETRQAALPKDPNAQPVPPARPPTPGSPSPTAAATEFKPPTLFDPRRSGKIAPPGPIKKSLDAGSGMAAPSQLQGGAVLVSEDLVSKKKKKTPWLLRAESEYKSWNKREFFEKFMSERMPNLTKGEIIAIGQVIALNKSINIEEALANIANMNVPKRITQSDPMNKAGGKDAIYTLILFEGCDLYDILHLSHFATDEVGKDTFEKITKVCDEYFKGGVKSHELKFNDSGELGKEGQSVLFLSEGDPYKDLFDKLSEVAKYKYSAFKPHISVTSNVDHFAGKPAHLVISVNGEIKRTYDFSK